MTRRWPMLLFVGIALGAFWLFGPKVPHDQTLHVILGDTSPAIREVALRYENPDRPSGKGSSSNVVAGEALREVSFRFPKGGAPRVLTHEPRFADGEYLVEIEVVTSERRATIRRNVGFHGGATSVDIGQALTLELAGRDGGPT